ncbi:MAG TPA: SDR family NAD(P)-dependent oxidoreductase, partial [Bacteroidia bacterium]|nr:SDR family NAD(P)-dependent oxidoreductase [Bacteroidia bacterium]
MRILVTGGTGFIGSHTAVALIENGHDVFIVDNLNNSRAEVVQSINKITGKAVIFSTIDCCDF